LPKQEALPKNVLPNQQALPKKALPNQAADPLFDDPPSKGSPDLKNRVPTQN
jgi:hypothetical protein